MKDYAPYNIDEARYKAEQYNNIAGLAVHILRIAGRPTAHNQFSRRFFLIHRTNPSLAGINVAIESTFSNNTSQDNNNNFLGRFLERLIPPQVIMVRVNDTETMMGATIVGPVLLGRFIHEPTTTIIDYRFDENDPRERKVRLNSEQIRSIFRTLRIAENIAQTKSPRRNR